MLNSKKFIIILVSSNISFFCTQLGSSRESAIPLFMEYTRSNNKVPILCNSYIIKYIPYKTKWRIPKLILRVCTINFNAISYIFVFSMSFESSM